LAGRDDGGSPDVRTYWHFVLLDVAVAAAAATAVKGGGAVVSALVVPNIDVVAS
jgi:hypothetical protein